MVSGRVPHEKSIFFDERSSSEKARNAFFEGRAKLGTE